MKNFNVLLLIAATTFIFYCCSDESPLAFELQESIEAIESMDQWKDIKTSDEAIDLLTSGSDFTVNFEEYQRLKKANPEFIHCYFGVKEGQIKLYLIDAKSDQNRQKDVFFLEKGYDRNISINPNFTTTYKSFDDLVKINKTVPKPTGHIVDKVEGDQRILDWHLFANDWFDYMNERDLELPNYMSIPFYDFDYLFANDKEDIVGIFALKNYEQFGFNIELLFGKKHITKYVIPASKGHNMKNTDGYADVTQPCPPFSYGG